MLHREASARIAELEAEVRNLKTVMVAAAEEIHQHWAAHCDAEGYGPQNLMRRLEEGIPSEYGYTAGAFVELRAEVARLRSFAAGVMESWPHGDVDGGELQDLAIAHGLLVPQTRHAPCAVGCNCEMYGQSSEDWAAGVTCYRQEPPHA